MLMLVQCACWLVRGKLGQFIEYTAQSMEICRFVYVLHHFSFFCPICTRLSFTNICRCGCLQAFIFKESESYHSLMLSLTASRPSDLSLYNSTDPWKSIYHKNSPIYSTLLESPRIALYLTKGNAPVKACVYAVRRHTIVWVARTVLLKRLAWQWLVSALHKHQHKCL